EKTGPSKRAAAVLGIGAVAAVAAMTVAGSLWATTAPDMDTEARPAQLPAAQASSVCSGIPMLPAGTDDATDVQFSADSSDACPPLAIRAASDLPATLPGTAYFAAETNPNDTPSPPQITESLPEDLQQGPPATAGTDGTVTNRAQFEVISDPA